MVFSIKNIKGEHVEIFDANGASIPNAFKYNSKTREVDLFLIGYYKNEPKILMKRRFNKNSPMEETVKIKVRIPGSYVLVNGKKF